MAERKTGPVKPPVIDLKARETDKSAPGTDMAAPKPVPEPEPVTESQANPEPASSVEPGSPEARPAQPPVDNAGPTPTDTAPPAPADRPAEARTESPQRPPQPEPEAPRTAPPPRPPARLAMPWSAISIAALGGALLGAVLVYTLGNWLPLPTDRPLIADPTDRLDRQDAGIADIAARLDGIEEQARRTQANLDSTIARLDTGLDELRDTIGSIESAERVDVVPLERRLQGLEDRVTALGAGASGADAEALAATIGNIESELAALREAGGGQSGRAGEVDAALAALREELTALQTAVSQLPPATAPTDLGPAVRLPLLVSGIEGAIANGRPFATELQTLGTLLPDLAVPPSLAATAETGLPRPDAVIRRFEAAVPDILAGRAAETTGDMGADALEWMKGLLALRPVGEVPGDGPEATVSRLEAAVLRRDFAGASALLSTLPPSMQAGAGTVGADIIALAEADAFLAELRTRAFDPVTEAAP